MDQLKTDADKQIVKALNFFRISEIVYVISPLKLIMGIFPLPWDFSRCTRELKES